MSVRVKICGITRAPDALAAIEAGADALGFVFCEDSARAISSLEAASIIAELPPFICKVGLFVNASESMIRQVIADTGIDTLQLHGDESPGFCKCFELKTIKAFRCRDEQSLDQMPAYKTDAWLLDSYVPGKMGGTGAKFNWNLAKQAKLLFPTIVLAGGLTPENVGEAVRQVHPYAVDVSSGVESTPGKKDAIKVRDFIRAAKESVVRGRGGA
jgi:phosphoribosylanthranilate isomerase